MSIKKKTLITSLKATKKANLVTSAPATKEGAATRKSKFLMRKVDNSLRMAKPL